MSTFANQIGDVNINFEAIPDLQPKAIRGIIKAQTLPEENILRSVIKTVPVDSKLFKARVDDQIDTSMTPEVDMNADDPMTSDKWRFKTDQVNEYRQATRINREVGQQLMALDGSPTRYAGQAELQRLIRNILVAIDNRREYNRAQAIINAHSFDASRTADLQATHKVSVSLAADKWDKTDKDAQGNTIVQPFNLITATANRLAFLSGKNPTDMVITPDVWTALRNHTDGKYEITAAKNASARGRIRELDVFVSQGRANVGTEDAARLKPLMGNLVAIGSLDQDSIAEMQYDINRVEQFVTDNKLFYYVRYWHKSKVHVSRPGNFAFIENVLAAPYDFTGINSLLV